MTTQYIRWPQDNQGGGGTAAPTVIGSVASPITSDGTATLVFGVTLTANNVAFVKSTGGAVVMAVNPQLPTCSIDGALLTLIGVSNTDTLAFIDGSGNDQNGTCVMNANQAITYRRDVATSTWIEESRRA